MKKIDLTGKRFGRLVIVSEASEKKRGKPAWNCRCDCGNNVTLPGNDIRVGDTTSCGCYRKDLLTEDLFGKVFEKLTVFEKAAKRGKSTSQFWKCKCECGKEKIASAQHLKLGYVKSCGCWFDYNITEEDRLEFFKHVQKTEKCWNWTGRKANNYGVFFKSKLIKAHRFSYIMHKGRIENKLIICHICDNPLCVNPDHLYAGTHKQNSEDMVNRKRQRKPLKVR